MLIFEVLIFGRVWGGGKIHSSGSKRGRSSKDDEGEENEDDDTKDNSKWAITNMAYLHLEAAPTDPAVIKREASRTSLDVDTWLNELDIADLEGMAADTIKYKRSIYADPAIRAFGARHPDVLEAEDDFGG